MPLYEFECKDCRHRFERIQSVAAPDPNCPKCGGAVERLLHAPAVQFKGSGWYATDYAKSGAAGAKSESKSEDKAETTPAKKSETTKTETKTETKSSSTSKE